MRPKKRKKRRPYHRLRPSENRLLDLIWSVIREWRSDLRPHEIAEMADVSYSHTKHVLARLAREGILERIYEPGEEGRFGHVVYDLTLDIGPIAPILHGGMHNVSGYTDINVRYCAGPKT